MALRDLVEGLDENVRIERSAHAADDLLEVNAGGFALKGVEQHAFLGR